MSKKLILATSSITVLLICAYIFIPISENKAEDLALTEFQTYCVENRLNHTKYSGPAFVKRQENGTRVYAFSAKTSDNEEVLFEVRVPQESGKQVTLGTTSNVQKISKFSTD